MELEENYRTKQAALSAVDTSKLIEKKKGWGFSSVLHTLAESPVFSRTKLVRGYIVSHSISEQQQTHWGHAYIH